MKPSDFCRRHKLKLLAVVVIVLGGWWAWTHGVSMKQLADYGRGLSAGWYLAAFFTLPLLGFPITPFLLLAGLRFGLIGGVGVAGAGIAFHNFAAFHLVHGNLRQRMSRRLQARGYSIPSPTGNNRIWFTMLFVGVQGPPYAVKLYLLALTDIPFSIYFGIGVPIYLLFSVVAVGAGSSAFAVNPLWIYLAVFSMMGLAFLGRWLKRRFGSRILMPK